VNKVERAIQALISIRNNANKSEKWIRSEIDDVIDILNESYSPDLIAGDNYLE